MSSWVLEEFLVLFSGTQSHANFVASPSVSLHCHAAFHMLTHRFLHFFHCLCISLMALTENQS